MGICQCLSKDSEELINDYINNLKISKLSEEEFIIEVDRIFKNETKNKHENYQKDIIGYKDYLTSIFFNKFIIANEPEIYYKSTIQYMNDTKKLMSSDLFIADSNTNLYFMYSLLFLCKNRSSQKDLFAKMKNLAFTYYSSFNYTEKDHIDETFYVKSDNEYLVRHVLFKKTIIFFMCFVSDCLLNSISIYYKNIIKDDFSDYWYKIFSENNKSSVIKRMFNKNEKLYIDFLLFETSDFITFTSHEDYRIRIKEFEERKEK